MTSGDIGRITSLANQICKAGNLVCKYQYCSRSSRFEWQFFRHGHLVGSTHVATEVIRKAERLVGNKPSAKHCHANNG